MSARTAVRVAWSLWAASALLLGIGLVLFVQSGHVPVDDHGGNPLETIDFLLFASVGALIVSRRPSNAIGWILCAASMASGLTLNGLGYGYVYDSLEGPVGRLPATEWVAWFSAWVNTMAGIPAGVLLLLVFPTGRPASRAWWAVLWVGIGSALLAGVAQAIQPGALPDYPAITNPVGMTGGAGEAATAVANATGVLTVALLVVGAASVVSRLHASRGVERQQLKWFAYAAAILALYFASMLGLATVWPDLSRNPIAFPILNFGWAVAIGLLPLSVGVAVLRYRLYEIDVLIRRTLVYAALTALLALVYWGAVLVLEQVLRPVTQGSDLAIVGSTLLVAAVFQPARRRIQDVVDRRFYRRKYDAARTLDAFASRLRQEVDLQQLNVDLLGVVHQTVQPTRVSLWLRDASREDRTR